MNFQYSFSVERSPAEVWLAVTSPQQWWSQQMEGEAGQLGSEVKYHYRDVHRCVFQVTEALPGRRLVWHVVENEFNFTKDRQEWVGTDCVFELLPEGAGTKIAFTHVGLVPAYECYEVCRDAWSTYLGGSLRALILTGQGQPSPIDDVVARAEVLSAEDFELRIHFPLPPAAVMKAVERPQDWWSTDIEGSWNQVDDHFVFQHKDLHRSVQRVTERIANRRVVWTVTDSRRSFVRDPAEWTGTKLVFEAFPDADGCELRFAHAGLNRSKECFADCAEGWTYFLDESLAPLILTGRGRPESAPGE